MLSKRIAYLRKKNSMSQAQLANKIGISPSALGMYEQGRREPSIEVIVSLSQIFGVSIDFLITGIEHVGEDYQSNNDLFSTCPCNTCFWNGIR